MIELRVELLFLLPHTYKSLSGQTPNPAPLSHHRVATHIAAQVARGWATARCCPDVAQQGRPGCLHDLLGLA